MGFNFRITDLQSAIGLSQLAKVKQRLTSLNQVYEKYAAEMERFPFLRLIPINISEGEVPLYVEVLCKERRQLINFLKKHGIQARPLYPDLNLAKHLESSKKFPHARIFGEQGLVLPCGPDQPLENIERVIDVFQLYGNTYR